MTRNAPSLRVTLELTGWKVHVDHGGGNPGPVGYPDWTLTKAMEYGALALRLATREWYARNCERCRKTGQLPDWGRWDAAHGEPKPKRCPNCQPEELWEVATDG